MLTLKGPPLPGQGKTLVTGATGFLGRQLLKALEARRVAPVALVRDLTAWNSQEWVKERAHTTPLLGSPLATEAWVESAHQQGVGTLIHAAAIVQHTRRSPEAMMELNVQGTLHMVRTAARLKARLVYISSSGTVGCYRYADVTADEHAPFAEDVVGRWPYYASKVRAEREARRLAESLGVELVVVRPPVLLGPEDHKLRSTGHVLKMIAGHVPAAPRGGMHFADVRDVAKAVARLPNLQSPRSVYHLPGTASTLMEFFRMVSEVSGVAAPEREVAPFVITQLAKLGAAAGALAKRPVKWVPDPVLAEMSGHYWGLSTLWSHEELGYQSRSPRQTLLDTVEWLRANHPALRAVAA
jgi:nucleoside-diphosphate-sugar epimerase